MQVRVVAAASASLRVRCECATPWGPAPIGRARRPAQHRLRRPRADGKLASNAAKSGGSRQHAATSPRAASGADERRQGTASAEQREGFAALRRGGEPEGYAYLFLVAFLWASYGPALRVAYGLPGPPTPVAVTLVTAVIELGVLGGAWLLTTAAPRTAGSAGGDEPAAASNAMQARPLRWLGLPAAALAGLEIGAYNTAATYTQIAGLELTAATRAAFLIQASILFTPLLSTLAGMAPSRPVWAGSLLALIGTAIITQDPGGSSSAAGQGAAAGSGALSLVWGDVLTLLAALSYSAATVRLPVWSVRYGVSPLQLSVGKCAVLTAVAAAAAGAQAGQLAAAGQPIASLWPGWHQPEGWGVMLWAAVGPGALANVLLVKGQSLVPPAAAQIMFCSIPLWSALMAAAVLPDEAVGPATWLGGGVVAAAGLVAARGGKKQSR